MHITSNTKWNCWKAFTTFLGTLQFHMLSQALHIRSGDNYERYACHSTPANKRSYPSFSPPPSVAAKLRCVVGRLLIDVRSGVPVLFVVVVARTHLRRSPPRWWRRPPLSVAAKLRFVVGRLLIDVSNSVPVLHIVVARTHLHRSPLRRWRRRRLV